MDADDELVEGQDYLSMNVIVWPDDPQADAVEHSGVTIGALWRMVNERDETRGNPGVTQEVTANSGEGGKPYLVLSWVEVEAE